MSENDKWGARIERGIIEEADENRFRVKSLCRDGVKTPWIKGIGNDPTGYEVGDRVYFFIFSDGHGAVIGRFE